MRKRRPRALDCAMLALVCGEAGGISGFDGDCFLPDVDPAARDVLTHGNTLVAQVRQANLLPAPRRTARLGELAPSVRAVESDLHGLALASAAASHEPPPPASITCTWDFFHCGCDNAFDCAWLSWFCGKLGGVGDFEGGCYLPDLTPGTELARGGGPAAQARRREAVDLPVSLLPGRVGRITRGATVPGRSSWRAPSRWTSSPVPAARGG